MKKAWGTRAVERLRLMGPKYDEIRMFSRAVQLLLKLVALRMFAPCVGHP